MRYADTDPHSNTAQQTAQQPSSAAIPTILQTPLLRFAKFIFSEVLCLADLSAVNGAACPLNVVLSARKRSSRKAIPAAI